MANRVGNGMQRRSAGASGFCVALAVAVLLAWSGAAKADALTKGAADYKPYVVEHIGKALKGARELQAAVKAGDVKKAQSAWIESRKGWEASEPITGEFFSDLDEAIDAWPDPEHGYHAVEAALFAGKLKEITVPVDKLVADLAEFDKKLGAGSFGFEPQGLLNGAAKLAYEVGENKSKGGESPYAGTSLVDMHENVEGIEALYQLAFEPALRAADAKLATAIHDKIEALEDLVGVKDLKSVDQPALKKAGEELAVLLQDAAPRLGLKKPSLEE